MSDCWRLLIHEERPADNMAIDEAIAQEVQRVVRPPTFRLYAWAPAACRWDATSHARPLTPGAAPPWV
jgi:hypothetical protein